MTLPSAHQSLPVVSLYDSALDVGKMDLVEYASTRDPDLVVEKPGVKATWFNLQPLSTRAFQGLIQPLADREAERRCVAFQLSVASVDHLVTRDGRKVAAYMVNGSQRIGDIELKMLADEQLDDFWPSVVDEIGEVAYRRGFFPDGCVDTLRVPRTWLSICLRRLDLAAASLATASGPGAPKARPPAEDAPELTGDAATTVTAPDA